MRNSDLYKKLVANARKNMVFLDDKPEECPESTIDALWMTAGGAPLSVESAIKAPLPSLDENGIVRLKGLFKDRSKGIPLQHLTGIQQFMGIDYLTGKGAMIPRNETEILGMAADSILKKILKTNPKPNVLDLCTGGGTIACTLAQLNPSAQVFASDICKSAIELARKNAVRLGVANRIELRCGDMFQPFEEKEFYHSFDLITCNPPYISTAKVKAMNIQIAGHEPLEAFDGGPFGIKFLMTFIHEAPRFVKPGCWIAFELGLGQGTGIKNRMKKQAGYNTIQQYYDKLRNIRVLSARVAFNAEKMICE